MLLKVLLFRNSSLFQQIPPEHPYMYHRESKPYLGTFYFILLHFALFYPSVVTDFSPFISPSTCCMLSRFLYNSCFVPKLIISSRFFPSPGAHSAKRICLLSISHSTHSVFNRLSRRTRLFSCVRGMEDQCRIGDPRNPNLTAIYRATCYMPLRTDLLYVVHVAAWMAIVGSVAQVSALHRFHGDISLVTKPGTFSVGSRSAQFVVCKAHQEIAAEVRIDILSVHFLLEVSCLCFAILWQTYIVK